jgi:hypothetical protein
MTVDHPTRYLRSADHPALAKNGRIGRPTMRRDVAAVTTCGAVDSAGLVGEPILQSHIALAATGHSRWEPGIC